MAYVVMAHNYNFCFVAFFEDLDKQWTPLTLHSSLIHLVKYVRSGIQRLIKEISQESVL